MQKKQKKYLYGNILFVLVAACGLLLAAIAVGNTYISISQNSCKTFFKNIQFLVPSPFCPTAISIQIVWPMKNHITHLNKISISTKNIKSNFLPANAEEVY